VEIGGKAKQVIHYNLIRNKGFACWLEKTIDKYSKPIDYFAFPLPKI
jgi:hypothetical protein